MSAKLDDVVKELKTTNENTKDTKDLIKKFLDKQTQMAGDQLEALREQGRRGRSPTASVPSRGSSNSGLGILSRSPAALIAPLIGGISAFAAAMAGLRGWEVGAIKKLKDIIKTNIPTTINNGVIRMRNAVLGIFGLTAEGLLTRDAQGRFQRAAPITTQIAMRMNALRIRALSMFGLGADGKPIIAQGDDGLFKKNIVGRVTFQINRLLSPLVKLSSGIVDFITGAGKGLFSFINANILGPAGKVAGFLGKLLKPIGVLFSAYEAVTAFMGEEGSVFDKTKAGFAAFFGDFLGAPLDLLKGAMTWILKNLLGLETNEDGTVKEGQGLAGDALLAVQKFNFKESINSLIRGVFEIGEAAFNWFAGLFTGETSIKDSLTNLWKRFLILQGGYLEIGEFVYNKAIAPITEWFAEKLGIKLDLPELDLKTMLIESYDNIKANFKAGLGMIEEWFRKTPRLIAIDAEEKFANAVAKIKIGFLSIAEFIGNVPNLIKETIFQSFVDFKANNPKLGYFLPDFTEDLKEIQVQRAQMTSTMEEARRSIETDLARKVAELEVRRAGVEAGFTSDEIARIVDASTNNASFSEDNSSTINMISEGFYNTDGLYQAAP